MRSLLLVESFDLRPSNQYILVRVTPGCFRIEKLCLCQVTLLSRCSPRYLTSSSWGSCTLFIWTGGHIPLRVVNVTWIDLDSLAFILHYLNQFWIASRSVCSFCEAMAGSVSMATTAVSSAKVAMVDSGEVSRCAGIIIALNFHKLQVQVILQPEVSRPVCLRVGPLSGAHDQIFHYCRKFAVFMLWSALPGDTIEVNNNTILLVYGNSNHGLCFLNSK
jgi:hypothetical protein